MTPRPIFLRRKSLTNALFWAFLACSYALSFLLLGGILDANRWPL